MMAWDLDTSKTSVHSESSGDTSINGYVGTRFSISTKGRLYLKDYNQQIAFHDDSDSYVRQVRRVTGGAWAGSIRIRANGDTYYSRGRKEPSAYLGNTSLGSDEHFPGYVLGANRNLPLHPPVPSLYSGAHNPFQVGERWSVPPRKFAKEEKRVYTVGQRYERGDWMWSETDLSDFVRNMRSLFNLEDVLRFYINCYGYVIHPVWGRYWRSYGIDAGSQLRTVDSAAPAAGHSLKARINFDQDDEEGSEEPNVNFVCGHWEDLTNSELLRPDRNDPRFGEINQDWGKWN